MAKPGLVEYGIVLGGVGCGCAVLLPPAMLIPGSIALPLAEIIAPEAHKLWPNVVPSPELTDEKKLDAVRGLQRSDAARGIIALASLLLIEIPAALPQVLPHMSKLSEKIPDIVPELTAIAAVVYGLSWLNMRATRKGIEIKLSDD